MSLAPSDHLADRYRILAHLGRGAFADVYQVEHLTLGTQHAAKVLRENHPEFRARMVAEGQLQARLRHPHIVRVTDIFDTADGHLVLIMDLVNGPTLSQRLANGPMSRQDALSFGALLISAVQAAHEQGVVHRDLKPDNILLTEEESQLVPRVTDFGLARAFHSVGPRFTQRGIGLGTPGYMAPEQFRDASSVDERADIFSLGAILYEVLTGQRASPGHSAAEVFRVAQSGARPPLADEVPDLPMGVVDAIESALDPNLHTRISTCAEMAALWAAPEPALEAMPSLHAVDTAFLRALDGMDTAALERLAATPTPEAPKSTSSFPLSPPRPTEASPQLSAAEPAVSQPPKPPTPPADPISAPSTSISDPIAPVSTPQPQISAPPADEARAALQAPQPARAFRVHPVRAALAVGLGSALAAGQITRPLDDALYLQLLGWVHGPLPASRTALAIVPDDDHGAWRAQAPALVNALVAAGAASVTFTVPFSTPHPADSALAEAIQAARASGVTVLGAGELRDTAWVGPSTPALADALTLGLADDRRARRVDLPAGKVQVHLDIPEHPDLWSLSVRTVQSWTPELRGPRYHTEDHTLEVSGVFHPTDNGVLLLHPVADSPQFSASRVDTESIATWPPLAGRAILVGPVGTVERREGAAVQAATIETLAAQRATHVIPRWKNAVFALFTGIFTVAATHLTSKLWIGIIVAIVSLLWVVAEADTGNEWAALPIATAALLGIVGVSRAAPMAHNREAL